MQDIILGMGFKGGKGFPEFKMVDGVKMTHQRDQKCNLMYDEDGQPIYVDMNQIGKKVLFRSSKSVYQIKQDKLNACISRLTKGLNTSSKRTEESSKNMYDKSSKTNNTTSKRTNEDSQNILFENQSNFP